MLVDRETWGAGCVRQREGEASPAPKHLGSRESSECWAGRVPGSSGAHSTPPRRWAHTPGRGRRVCTAFLQGVRCTPHHPTIGPPRATCSATVPAGALGGVSALEVTHSVPPMHDPPPGGGLLQQVRDREGSGARRALQPERPTSQPDPHPLPDGTPRPRPSFQASTWAPVWAQRPCSCSRKLISPSPQPDGRTGTCYRRSH